MKNTRTFVRSESEKKTKVIRVKSVNEQLLKFIDKIVEPDCTVTEEDGVVVIKLHRHVT